MITTTPWSLRIPQHGDSMAAEILDKSGNVIGFMRDWQQVEYMINQLNPVSGFTRDEAIAKVEELKEDLELAERELGKQDLEILRLEAELSDATPHGTA